MRYTRPADYLVIVHRHVQCDLLLAWLVMLVSICAGLVASEVWRVVVALMVVHAMAGR